MHSNADECKPSITTASGSSAPQQICAGKIIFDENFDTLDKQKWKPLVTFWDGGVSVHCFCLQNETPIVVYSLI